MSSDEHRRLAKAKLASFKKANRLFAERVAIQGESELDNDEVVQVLRCIIHAKPGGPYAKATDLGRHMWRQYNFAKLWRGQEVDDLINVLSRRQAPPNDDYQALHEALAKIASTMLNLRDEHLSTLLAHIKIPRSTLQASLDAALDFAARSQVAFEPAIYSPLDEAPYWDTHADASHPDPVAKGIAAEVLNQLKTNTEKRIVYVSGPHFSAKREILKAVVRQLEAGCLVRHDNARLPALAIAAESVSVELFIDRVFRFFASRVPKPATEELAKNLNMDDKIAFIEAAAQTAPVLFVVADLEVFDADATIRRLRGDRVGDVIQTVLDANQNSRLLMGVLSDEDLPWQADAIRFPVKALQDELIEAIGGLTPDLARKYQAILAPEADPRAETTLDSLVMRLAIAVFERSRGQERLAVKVGRFVEALKSKSPDAVFDCVWRDMTDKADRLRLGLIATSHDGLRTATFIKLLTAMRAMKGDADTKAALADIDDAPEALIAWARRYDRVVRLRDDGGPKATSFYFRDAIRKQVLRAWMRDHPDQSRDAFWCLAREAADQANTHILTEGAEEADYPLARNLQALQALLASIDPNAAAAAEDGLAPLGLPLAATNIVPSLAQASRERPCPRLTYIFAWRTLYKLELERGEFDIDGRLSAPTARLTALLAFLAPTRPWSDSENIDQLLASLPFERAMGLAARILSPGEQLELLTRLAISAYRARRFRLVLVALGLVEELERRHPDLPVTACVRVYRLRLALGLFYCGDPLARDPKLLPSDQPASDDESRLNLGWAIKEADRLLGRLSDDPQRDSIIARGKLHMRLVALEHWAGNADAAGSRLADAKREETALFDRGYEVGRLPISAGKGVRSAVRYMLWSQARGAFKEIAFACDGLKWPTPDPERDEAAIALARLLLDANLLRARRGDAGARLNVKMDDVRLAMHLGAFDTAENEIAEAVAIANRGAAFEALFELADLRASLAVETAMRSLAEDASNQRCIEAMDKLNTALDSLRKLQRLGPLPLVDAMLRYHEGQTLIVRSRTLQKDSTERREALVDARDALNEAMETMEEAGLGLYRDRISRTHSALDSVLAAPVST